jgi:hypothetical protein
MCFVIVTQSLSPAVVIIFKMKVVKIRMEINLTKVLTPRKRTINFYNEIIDLLLCKQTEFGRNFKLANHFGGSDYAFGGCENDQAV